MALATTCPRCKTSFRVVPDQLKLRRGFVRCGRCRNVFAGIDHLRYVEDGQLRSGADADTNADADAGAVDDAAADAEVEYVVVGAPPHDPLAHDPLAAEALGADEAAHIGDAHADEAGRDEAGADTMRREDESPDEPVRDEARDAPFDEESSRDAPPDRRADEAPAWLERYAPSAAADTPPAHDAAAGRLAPADGFDDEAEGESAIDYFSTRRSRGFADRRGIAAAFVALALAVALVLQFVVAERATIAARAPALAPVLGAVLAPFGLGIGAPSELDALTIESFELQASEVPDVLEMRALLRNHADHPVRWPSMQLTLTDRSDRVLVRRTLAPGDYLRDAAATPDEGLPAQTEWPLHLALEARDLHLTGYDYRVRLFYP